MKRCTILLIAAAAALPAAAQTMKPGLWETASKIESGNGEMASAMAQIQKQMAAMPPEQRKVVAEMMAKHGAGTQMPTMNPDGSIVTKVCMTKDMIARSQLLSQQQNGTCTHKNSPIVRGVMTMSFSCTNPPSSGDARFVFQGDTGYSMTMNAKGVRNGKDETMTVDTSGKWLGADCGSVKPLAMPPAAPPAK